MKIEANKNHQTESKKDSSVRRGESALHRFLHEKEIFDSKPNNNGAFEKILAETRKPNRRDDDFSANLKNSADSDVKTDETSDRLELALSGKDEIEEKNEHDGETGGEQSDSGESHTSSSTQISSSNAKSASENPIAAARSILHVADLERIVATIRTETFKNAKQVQIALKHSVLDGLEIKLTIDGNGKLKAEFIAQNEQIKKQINARKRELGEIFVQRAVNFSSIEVVDKNENAE